MRLSTQMTITARFALVLGAVAAARSTAQAEPMPLPFEECFRGPQVDPAWKTDVSHGNKIVVADGSLKILTHQMVHPHQAAARNRSRSGRGGIASR